MSMENHDVGAMWDRRYEEHGWSVLPDASLSELVSRETPGRAIDLGCGTGRNSLFLARLGWRVTGVDISLVGLQVAANQAASEGLEFTSVYDDLTTYQPEFASYDLVVVANIHLPPSERVRLFERSAQAVAPGGHLFITGHHVRALGHGGPLDPERRFTTQMFDAGFDGLTTEILEERTTASDTGEGEDVNVVVWSSRRISSEEGTTR